MQTIAPEVSGRVIDGATGLPLAGARVASVSTDGRGRFLLRGKRTPGIATTMGGVWRLPTVMFRVSKPGYHSLHCRCESLSTQGGCRRVTVALVPLDRPTASPDRVDPVEGFSCSQE
jgi:hypothetical protein